MFKIIFGFGVLIAGATSIYVQPFAAPYYFVTNGLQTVPVVREAPIQTYGLLDFDLSRILAATHPVQSRVSRPVGTRAQNPITTITTTDVIALTNITMCFFLGNDVVDSHLLHNKRWWFSNKNYEGLKTYINDLTLATNGFLGLENFKLKWSGPYERSDKEKRYPENMAKDTIRTAKADCDVAIFLVFNNYTASQTTSGHKYSGFVDGGPCENVFGKGYAVIVDQGFFNDVWMGPQVLAHHLLLMLTVDLWSGPNPVENRFCPNENSLLNQNVKPGKQVVDQCVINKLNKSNVSIRPCLLDVF